MADKTYKIYEQNGFEVWVTKALKDKMEGIPADQFWKLETTIIKVEDTKLTLGDPKEGDPKLVDANFLCPATIHQLYSLRQLLDPCIHLLLMYLKCKIDKLKPEYRKEAVFLLVEVIKGFYPSSS